MTSSASSNTPATTNTDFDALGQDLDFFALNHLGELPDEYDVTRPEAERCGWGIREFREVAVLIPLNARTREIARAGWIWWVREKFNLSPARAEILHRATARKGNGHDERVLEAAITLLQDLTVPAFEALKAPHQETIRKATVKQWLYRWSPTEGWNGLTLSEPKMTSAIRIAKAASTSWYQVVD